MTRQHRGFTHVHPPGLSLTRGPRVERGPFGLNPGLRTPQSPAGHAGAGTGHRALARTTSSSPRPPADVSTSRVRPRVARSGSPRFWRSHPKSGGSSTPRMKVSTLGRCCLACIPPGLPGACCHVTPAAGVKAGRRPPGGLGLDAGEDGAILVGRGGVGGLVLVGGEVIP
jgi:hypothetical protein